MVKALGIEIRPLLDDPLPPNGFAPWEPWPPGAAEHLFIERFRELASCVPVQHVAIPNALLRMRGMPSCDAIPGRRSCRIGLTSTIPASTDDPGAEHAAYDEWAAIAGDPVPRAAVSLEERTGHAAASFDAIAATLTETQVAAAAHPGLDPGPGRGRDRQDLDPHRRRRAPRRGRRHPAASGARRHVHQQGGQRDGEPHPRRARPGRGALLARHIPRPRGPSASRFSRSRVLAGKTSTSSTPTTPDACFAAS